MPAETGPLNIVSPIPGPSAEPSSEVKDMQRILFGMHTSNFAAVLGTDVKRPWMSVEQPFEPFKRYNVPVPPRDAEGLVNLHTQLGDYDISKFAILGRESQLSSKSNLLVIGGTSVNDYAKGFLAGLPARPFRFVFHNLAQFELQRIYVSSEGQEFRHTSRFNQVLMKTNEPDRSPLGPVVSSDGKIVRDIILLTIGPTRDGKHVTHFYPEFGAGVCLPNIINNGDVLEALLRGLGRQESPWLQAAFSVPVYYDQQREIYGIPDLIEVRPLATS